MSLILIEQFDEFADAYPELAQCYDFTITDSKDVDDDFYDWED